MPRPIGAATLRLSVISLLALAACGPAHVVPLTMLVPVTVQPPIPLEVVTRESGISDPLHFSDGHSRVVFAGLEEPMGHAVATAAVPWAELHRADRPDGWQLLVELTQADVQRRSEQVVVTLGVRATLSTRQGNQYLAQTQAHCKQAAFVTPTNAAPVFYNCMMNVGRELAGWLGGVTP
jgi:hypothetical protein